jgi:hypothetical protein
MFTGLVETIGSKLLSNASLPCGPADDSKPLLPSRSSMRQSPEAAARH